MPTKCDFDAHIRAAVTLQKRHADGVVHIRQILMWPGGKALSMVGGVGGVLTNKSPGGTLYNVVAGHAQ